MRFLIISLCLLFVGCASYSKKQGLTLIPNTLDTAINPYFSNSEIDYVYKANIDIYKKSFGGLFIIKKINADEHRLVFTTEMGKTLLDFSFFKDDFKVNYIIDDMNKKMLINILKNDFNILITENFNSIRAFKQQDTTIFESKIDNKTYYVYGNSFLHKIVRTNKTKEKAVFTFSEINNNFANQITIEHKNIQLKITLKSIQQ